MIKTSFLLLATLAVGIITACNPQNTPQFADNIVVAHRGAWKNTDVPENSLASLRQAIDMKCTGTEFDVWRTADDSLVIHHDADFEGMEIEKTTYQELTHFKLKNGEDLPTLRQYLSSGMENNHETRLICEIKPSKISKEFGQETAHQALELVQKLGAESYVVYISFDYNILLKLLILDPNLNTQYLNGDKSPSQCKADGIKGIDYHFSVFQKKPEWIEEAKKEGIDLNSWTVNDPEIMDWMIDQKFDFITTNEPELLFGKLK